MKAKTVFILRCYGAIALFVLCAYVVTFQKDHWFYSFITYNLSAKNDAFPALQRYAQGIMQPEDVPVMNFRRFLMPVNGDILINFQERLTQESELTLDGVILKSRPGSKVIVGDDGKIATIDFKEGIGWYIDIDHGNGIFSRYGNLAHISKKTGDTVRRGENLGKVSTSYNGKFLLQLFINGEPVNPVTATLMQKGI